METQPPSEQPPSRSELPITLFLVIGSGVGICWATMSFLPSIKLVGFDDTNKELEHI
jgi:hypothetical protein